MNEVLTVEPKKPVALLKVVGLSIVGSKHSPFRGSAGDHINALSVDGKANSSSRGPASSCYDRLIGSSDIHYSSIAWILEKVC